MLPSSIKTEAMVPFVYKDEKNFNLVFIDQVFFAIWVGFFFQTANESSAAMSPAEVTEEKSKKAPTEVPTEKTGTAGTGTEWPELFFYYYYLFALTCFQQYFC